MKTFKDCGVLGVVLGFFVGICAAQHAAAQDDATDSGEAQARMLEEVVVTARKREESLIDVPV